MIMQNATVKNIPEA